MQPQQQSYNIIRCSDASRTLKKLMRSQLSLQEMVSRYN